MNPISMLHNLNQMSQVEVFNYIRYVLKPSQVAAIIRYYERELPSLATLDNDLATLHLDLQPKMKILYEYLQ